MLPTSFRSKLDHKIEAGLVCLGKFDGKHGTLAVVTSGNRIVLHDTWNKTHEHEESSVLNMNREISAIASGPLDGQARDMLLVGSPTSLSAYDVYNNCDLFFIDVQEGVNSILYGRMHLSEKPLVYVGGNCSLQGFDQTGAEEYWTVVGGNVTSLAFCDADRDGSNELLVGSDDFEIRVFQNEQSIIEVTETESVTHLCPMGSGDNAASKTSRFAYALKNGTVGIYDGSTRVWRVKAKDSVQAMISFDIDGDGVEELITGWSNGKLEARRDEDGSVVYRETLSSPISALLKGDFRGIGKEELLCCTLDGEIRGYDVCSETLFTLGQVSGAVGDGNAAFDDPLNGDEAIPGKSAGEEVMEALFTTTAAKETQSIVDNNDEEDEMNMETKHQTARANDDYEYRDATLAKLQEELTLKMMQLRSLEDALENSKTGAQQVGALPPGTEVNLSLKPNEGNHCLDLMLEMNNNDTVIQNVIVFALDGGIFPDNKECQMASAPNTFSRSLVVSLRPLKDHETTLNVQTFVSARGSSEYQHVFEQKVDLAKFAMFSQSINRQVPAQDDESIGTVSFVADGCTMETILEAMKPMFREDEKFDTSKSVSIDFFSLREDQCYLGLVAQEASTCVKVLIRSGSMSVAAEFIQELFANRVGLKTLESTVDFPSDLRHLEELMQNVQELHNIRQRFGAEMADESHYIKSLIVKAEDARLLNDITNLSQTYQELTTMNVQLIGEYNKRANNQQQLLDMLREVNNIIQKASMLRIGKPRTTMVAACRKAIKTSNVPALFHAITSKSSQ